MENILDEWKSVQEKIAYRKWREAEKEVSQKNCKIETYSNHTSFYIRTGLISGQGVNISSIDKRLVEYFPFSVFNKVQAEVADTLFHSSRNVLVCAPTGTGKTELSSVAIIREIVLNEEKVKAIYVAPTRSLVQEIEIKLKNQFKNLTVISDTTDKRVSNYKNINILITTPEKLDLLTGKKRVTYNLLVIDEIHVLGERRGGIIESIVIRARKCNARIIGMSATLSNYREIGKFIGADKNDCFYFSHAYREIEIAYTVVGMEKGKESLPVLEKYINNSTLIFLSSREDCEQLACILKHRYEKEKESENEKNRIKEKIIQKIDTLLGNNGLLNNSSKLSSIFSELLQIKNILSKSSDNIFFYGIGVHHSSLSRAERKLVEYLFSEQILSIICCTGTLACGVNLPADTVIVYGTEIFKESVGWTEYTLSEMAQMCGRAGRKAVSNSIANAVIITEKEKQKFYTRVPTFQFPVESSLFCSIETRVLYEIASGVDSLESLSEWFKCTFSYLRSHSHSEMQAYISDPTFIIQSVLNRLQELECIALCSNLSSYKYIPTPLGKCAFMHYLDPVSVHSFHRILLLLQRAPEYFPVDAGDILLIASTAQDFNSFHVLPKEEKPLSALEKHIPYPVRKKEHYIYKIISSAANIRPKASILFQYSIQLSFSAANRLNEQNLESRYSALSAQIRYTTLSIPRIVQALFYLSRIYFSRYTLSVLDLSRAATCSKWIHRYNYAPNPLFSYFLADNILHVHNINSHRIFISIFDHLNPVFFSITSEKIFYISEAIINNLSNACLHIHSLDLSAPYSSTFYLNK